ncbi:EamA family transporter [Chromobacterium vaccinii]|uniref:EamA family transporter n=1 Tax=Chromobacterium vaccinii TaxID=1108595 RepID=UPI000E1A0633|nr:EamA family transporter [Chromobacterium vaccinii]SUX56033.1 EamA-like transporter family [Chromobacterium vaccinii]
MTGLISWRLGEKRFHAIQWLGMALGLAGTALVIAGSKGVALAGGAGAAFVIAGLLLITGGTLYQRYRGGGAHPVAGAFHQYLSALAVTGALALLFERGVPVVWSGKFIFALGWSVTMLSVLAVLLLLRMLRDGDVSRVAAYLYLVPGLTAVQAWWLFDERLSTAAMGVSCWQPSAWPWCCAAGIFVYRAVSGADGAEQGWVTCRKSNSPISRWWCA